MRLQQGFLHLQCQEKQNWEINRRRVHQVPHLPPQVHAVALPPGSVAFPHPATTRVQCSTNSLWQPAQRRRRGIFSSAEFFARRRCSCRVEEVGPVLGENCTCMRLRWRENRVVAVECVDVVCWVPLHLAHAAVVLADAADAVFHAAAASAAADAVFCAARANGPTGLPTYSRFVPHACASCSTTSLETWKKRIYI